MTILPPQPHLRRSGGRLSLRLICIILAIGVVSSAGVWVVIKRFPVWFPEFSVNATAWITTSHLQDPPPALADLPIRVRTQAKASQGGTSQDKTSQAKERGVFILISGNAGWWAIDNDIVDHAFADGWNVVGINSVSFFGLSLHPKRPADLVTLINRIAEYYPESREGLVLAGYSFGADVIMASHSEIHSRATIPVSKIVLLAPSLKADFAIGISKLYPLHATVETDVAAALAKIEASSVLCIHGEDEQDTPCRNVARANISVQELPGGHHFRGDYRRLNEVISHFLPDSAP